MVSLLDLWLPILLSGVAVFVVSSVIHMALQIHKGDLKKLPGEDAILATMRAQNLAPGSYMFPCAGSMKEMCTPEMQAKMNQGPVGNVNILPNGPLNMGKALGQWFALSLMISAIAGYAAGIVLPAGADGMTVFRLTSTAALLGYAFAHAQDSIWKGVSWGISAKFFFDGLLYALATGGTFAWLWPAAATGA